MVNVKKRNGEIVPFDPSRIENSLHRAGVSSSIISQILNELRPKLFEGISTDKIYKIVFSILRKKKRSAASKFGLKTALAKLGPKGHNFETFISHILREKGYATQVRQTLEGKCVSHEMDVVAKKGNITTIAECKFHNQPWIYCPIQTALYTYARFLDIRENKRNQVQKVMLVTNTRFSSEVVKYAKCVGMELMGWKYPPQQGLEKIVDSRAIYPLTVLQTLNKFEMERLLNNNLVLVKDLEKLSDEKLQEITQCSPEKVKKIKEEVKELLKS